ncbi:MAG TPA: hypothetical protein VH480_02980 [Streptosporangiaceae bacterium]
MVTPGSRGPGRPGRADRPGRDGRLWQAWPGAVLALGLASVALAGCTGGGHPAAGSSHSAAASASPAGAPAGSAGASASALTLCRVKPTRDMRKALNRTVPKSLSGEVVPLGMSRGGKTAYVSTWTSRFSGVAALNLASGHVRAIHPFRNSNSDQADGSSGGRWVAWEETYSLRSLDYFTVYAWDSATGKLLKIGHSIKGRGGTPYPSPWHPPAVNGHYAAWAQGYGPGNKVEVRLANLATGRVKVVRTGHTQPPFFDKNLLVWPESDQPGTQTTLHAINVTTGRPAKLPPVLRAVHGTDFVVSDGTRTAYFSPNLNSLFYSPAQNQEAQVALHLPTGAYFADLALGPGTLAWTTTAATYLASTKTGAYIQVTRQYGDAVGSGSSVLISDAPSRKAPHPILPMHVISPGHLTWPSCSV